jgi:hypothetical protein
VGTLGFESSAFRVRFQCQGCGKIIPEDETQAHKLIHGLVINISTDDELLEGLKQTSIVFLTKEVDEDVATRMVNLAFYIGEGGYPTPVVTKATKGTLTNIIGVRWEKKHRTFVTGYGLAVGMKD